MIAIARPGLVEQTFPCPYVHRGDFCGIAMTVLVGRDEDGRRYIADVWGCPAHSWERDWAPIWAALEGA